MIVNILADELHFAFGYFCIEEVVRDIYPDGVQVDTYAVTAFLSKRKEHTAFSATDFQDIDTCGERLCFRDERKDVGAGIIYLLVETRLIIFMLL